MKIIFQYTLLFGGLCKLALIFTMLDNFMYYIYNPERSGSVVEYLSRDRWDGGSSLTNVTVMCP